MAMASPLAAVMERGAGPVPARTGNRHPGLAIAPYNAYQASDGYVVIFCVTERHWEALLPLLDRQDLLGDTRYGSNVNRAERMVDVDDIVQRWVSTQTRESVISRLTAAHVPCAPVLEATDVINDRHLMERGAWVDMVTPAGNVRLPNAPLRLHGTPLRGIERLAPSLGADTTAVMEEFLARPQKNRSLRRPGGVCAHDSKVTVRSTGS